MTRAVELSNRRVASGLVVLDQRPGVRKPDRVNCAGRCQYCGEVGCRRTRCIREHEQKLWTVCDRCDGMECYGPDLDPCGCMSGMMEASTALEEPTKSAALVAVLRRWW